MGKRTLEELQREQELNDCQAFIVGVSKLLFWHVAQIAWYLVAYIAYKEFMGPWQFAFATMVACGQACYFAVIFLALVYSTKFLLFCPLSNTNGKMTVVYFLTP